MSYSSILSKQELDELTNWNEDEEYQELFEAANIDSEDNTYELPIATTTSLRPPITNPPPTAELSKKMIKENN